MTQMTNGAVEQATANSETSAAVVPSQLSDVLSVPRAIETLAPAELQLSAHRVPSLPACKIWLNPNFNAHIIQIFLDCYREVFRDQNLVLNKIAGEIIVKQAGGIAYTAASKAQGLINGNSSSEVAPRAGNYLILPEFKMSLTSEKQRIVDARIAQVVSRLGRKQSAQFNGNWRDEANANSPMSCDDTDVVYVILYTRILYAMLQEGNSATSSQLYLFARNFNDKVLASHPISKSNGELKPVYQEIDADRQKDFEENLSRSLMSKHQQRLASNKIDEFAQLCSNKINLLESLLNCLIKGSKVANQNSISRRIVGEGIESDFAKTHKKVNSDGYNERIRWLCDTLSLPSRVKDALLKPSNQSNQNFIERLSNLIVELNVLSKAVAELLSLNNDTGWVWIIFGVVDLKAIDQKACSLHTEFIEVFRGINQIIEQHQVDLSKDHQARETHRSLFALAEPHFPVLSILQSASAINLATNRISEAIKGLEENCLRLGFSAIRAEVILDRTNSTDKLTKPTFVERLAEAGAELRSNSAALPAPAARPQLEDTETRLPLAPLSLPDEQTEASTVPAAARFGIGTRFVSAIKKVQTQNAQQLIEEQQQKISELEKERERITEEAQIYKELASSLAEKIQDREELLKKQQELGREYMAGIETSKQLSKENSELRTQLDEARAKFEKLTLEHQRLDWQIAQKNFLLQHAPADILETVDAEPSTSSAIVPEDRRKDDVYALAASLKSPKQQRYLSAILVLQAYQRKLAQESVTCFNLFGQSELKDRKNSIVNSILQAITYNGDIDGIINDPENKATIGKMQLRFWKTSRCQRAVDEVIKARAALSNGR